MEESEKRRERLKAMRIEAAQAEVSDNVDTSTTFGYLSNPLIESSATPPLKESSPAVPRFDFYTDPMSAFSGSKRTNNSNQTPQNYISSTPSSGSPMAWRSPSLSGPGTHDVTPVHQFPTNHSPAQRMYEASLALSGSDSWRSPVGMAGPFPAHQGTPPGAWNRSGGSGSDSWRSPIGMAGPFPAHQGTPPGAWNRSGGSGPDSWRSPIGMAGPFPAHQGTPPGAWNRSGGRAGYNLPFHSSRGGGFRSPGFGRGGSCNPSSGRGSSHHFSNSSSSGSGRCGGRGRGFRGFVSARDRPEMFYNKSMVEDPWRLLKPVIRHIVVKTLNTPETPTSWLPKSITMKKAKVSEAANEFSSQSSLAEYLAASFEEVVNDATDV